MFYVRLDRVRPNPWQTRPVNDIHVRELAADVASLKENRPSTRGLLQLPAGRLVDEFGQPFDRLPPGGGDVTHYLEEIAAYVQLAFGHHRHAAFLLLHQGDGEGFQPDPDYALLPLDLGEFSDELMARIAFVENSQREDLSPLEEAEAIHRMMIDFDWTHGRIAEELGLSRSAVANKLRLLRLDDQAQQAVRDGAVSERQALAILPVMELPAPALERANAYGYAPSALVQEAQKGLSSDELRKKADHTIQVATLSFQPVYGMPFPIDQPFDLEGVHSPRCDDCALRVRRKNELRCPDRACWKLKEAAYATIRLAEATEATGIPVASEDEEYRYNTENSFCGEPHDLVGGLVEEGCPHSNLRLRFDLSRNTYHPDGFPDVKVVCHHGDQAKRCHCLATKKGARTRQDPRLAEQRTREREIRDQVFKPAVAILSTALASGHVGAWKGLLDQMSYTYRGKGKDWTLEQIQTKVAEWIVKNWLNYTGNVDAARATASRLLDEFGLAAPWQKD